MVFGEFEGHTNSSESSIEQEPGKGQPTRKTL